MKFSLMLIVATICAAPSGLSIANDSTERNIKPVRTGLTLEKVDIPGLNKAKALNRNFVSDQGSIYRAHKIYFGYGSMGFKVYVSPIKLAHRNLKPKSFSFSCSDGGGTVGGGTIEEPKDGYYILKAARPDGVTEVTHLEFTLYEVAMNQPHRPKATK